MTIELLAALLVLVVVAGVALIVALALFGPDWTVVAMMGTVAAALLWGGFYLALKDECQKRQARPDVYGPPMSYCPKDAP